MIDPMTIMSVAEVADYLRVGESAVRRLIAKGDIPSFDVDGEPRVQYGALVQWFQGEAHARSLERLRQEIQKPSTWRNALDEHPAIRDEILAENHADGTFGAFLKDAALSEEQPSAQNAADTAPEPEPPSQLVSQPPELAPEPRQADAQEYLRRICRRPAIAVVVAVGLVIVALGAFTDALQKIATALRSLLSAVF